MVDRISKAHVLQDSNTKLIMFINFDDHDGVLTLEITQGIDFVHALPIKITCTSEISFDCAHEFERIGFVSEGRIIPTEFPWTFDKNKK